MLSCHEIDFHIPDNDLVHGVLQVATIVRPLWPVERIQYTVFKDGITNKLFKVYLEDDKDSTMLVRIYGENTEHIIDRAAEIRNIKILGNFGFAPRLYATFNNGIAYQFIPGVTLNVNSCRDEEIFPLVAHQMAMLHQQLKHWEQASSRSKDTKANPVLWDKIELFLSLVPEKFNDSAKQQRFLLQIPPISALKREFQWLKETLCKLDNEVVFCHNDLLLANILYDEDLNSINFIDLEYAAPNYQAYDIANHFCEFAGVDDVDHSLYPNEEFRRRWLAEYLRSYSGGKEVDQEILQQTVEIVEKFSIACHFFWGVWSLIQAAHSTIPFDFIGYSISRLDEYSTKKKLLW